MPLLARLRPLLGPLRWPSLAIVVAGALIVLLCDGFVAYVVWSSHRQAVRSAESETADLARVLQEFVLKTVQGVDLMLSSTARTIAADPSLRTPGNPRLAALLRQQRMVYPGVGGLAVIDANGDLVTDTQGNGGAGRAYTFADRAFMAAHRGDPSRGLFFDAPRIGRVNGMHIIGVSRALLDPDGNFDGVVFAALTVTSLHEMFAAVNVGHTGAISLFRDDGLLLARTPDDGAIVGSTMAGVPLFVTHLPQAASGTFEGSGTADGVSRRISYRRLPGLPLVVTVARATSEVLATWRSNAWTYAIAAAIVNFLILGLGALLAREVARREASETEVRERERLIRLVADNVPMLIAYVDKNRVYRFANRLAARWMNTPVEAFAGRKVEDVVPPAFYERSKERIEAALAGTYLRFEEQRTYGDGVERWADVSYVPVREGEAGGYIVLVSDISDRKAAEERLREREDQLRQAQKMEVVGQLTGGVAHDFNNLLSVIVGNLDLLAMDLADPRQRPILQRAIDAVERGGTLTRQLLAFSRKQMLQPRSIDVAELLDDVGALLRRTLGESVVVAAVADDGLWPCRADRHQLETALLNLALNARDAMAKGGRLAIVASNFVLDAAYARRHAEVTPGDYVAIAVSDDGTGMTAEIAARAFEPFFTTKEVGKGSGLGLSMVYGFCKQSGGHVRLASEPGAGTTVTLYLPRADSPPRRAEPAPPPVPRGRGQRILVVEDNAPLREVAVTALRNLGYTTFAAETADDALAVLADRPEIALLFTDVMLAGGRSGFELAAEAQARRPRLKVLYASGHPNLDPSAPGGRFGASLPEGAVIVAKPLRVADLAKRVETALES
ncbi:MAG: ATP-binding protein [Caldimonas sp.]